MPDPIGQVLFVTAMFLLCGCEELGLHNPLAEDQVPDRVKEQPLLVERASPPPDDAAWPRLGDVPFKPKDFSPKLVYDHYMNELEFDRAESGQAKQRAAVEDTQMQPEPAPNNVIPTSSGLIPPQLPLTPKE